MTSVSDTHKDRRIEAKVIEFWRSQHTTKNLRVTVTTRAVESESEGILGGVGVGRNF
jgi:hypothetical protein